MRQRIAGVAVVVKVLLRNAGKYTMADLLAYRLKARPVRAMAALDGDVIVLGAGGWWVSASTGSYGGASKGKQFVLGGAIGALIIGLGRTMVNLLFNAGQGG